MKRLRDRRVRIAEPEGEWEFTTRKEDGQRSLYARFVPPRKEDAER